MQILGSSFTRPANTTAYSSGQLMANNTTAGSVVALAFSTLTPPNVNLMIRKGRLRHTNASSFTATLYLFDALPTTSVGDGGTASGNIGPTANSIGQISFGAQNIYSDGASIHGTPIVGSEIAVKIPANQTIYGLVVVSSSYTPTSGETIAIALEAYEA